MRLSDLSVKRPVFATVLSLMLVALGALSFRDLTVREYPDTVAPTVQVQVGYPGASADIVETRETIERHRQNLERFKEDEQNIVASFNHDIDRFKALKGLD